MGFNQQDFPLKKRYNGFIMGMEHHPEYSRIFWVWLEIGI
jgi:hypothetical protein